MTIFVTISLLNIRTIKNKTKLNVIVIIGKHLTFSFAIIDYTSFCCC